MSCEVLGEKLSPLYKKENGEELLLFCQNNNLAIVSSIFSYSQNSGGTWPLNTLSILLIIR